METAAHGNLKTLAVAFLMRHGCQAVAREVGCPISRWRVDVAGYTDLAQNAELEDANGTLWQAKQKQPRLRRKPATILIECKQSRADFLSDCQERDELLRERNAIEKIQKSLEQKRIKIEEPQLRQSGTYLFGELEQWDFTRSQSRAYRQVQHRIRRIEKKLYGQTKFWLIARYRLADRLYLMAPRGLISQRELPRGWGLIECSARKLAAKHARPAGAWRQDEELPARVTVRAPQHEPRPEYRQRVLRNIAVAATRRVIAIETTPVT